MKRKTKNSCLMLCSTPFQALILERIVELNPENQYYLLMLKGELTGNSKNIFYFNKLRRKCTDSMIINIDPGLIGFIKFRFAIRNTFLDRKFDEIYIASIQIPHYQYIISKNSQALIYTFDDGLANILPSGLLHRKQERSSLKTITLKIFGVRHTMADIKNMSCLHYTVFKNTPNIVPNTKLVSLYKLSQDNNTYAQIKRIYIGQPLQEVSLKFTDEYVHQILRQLKIDFYFPHPREKSISLEAISVIETELIFEDYLLKYLQLNPNVKVEVFSFLSSALINVANFERVAPIYLYDDYIHSIHKDFYYLANKRFNIPFLKVNAD